MSALPVVVGSNHQLLNLSDLAFYKFSYYESRTAKQSISSARAVCADSPANQRWATPE